MDCNVSYDPEEYVEKKTDVLNICGTIYRELWVMREERNENKFLLNNGYLL